MKQTEMVRHRLAEAQHDAVALGDRLAVITKEKRTLLGAQAVDHKALRKLEDEESHIPAMLQSLKTRCDLLTTQLENAEKEEASLRIAAIEAEHQTLARSLEASRQEWIDGLARLATLFTEAQASKARLHLLTDESNYLVERYGTRPAHLRAVPVPSRDDVTRKLEDGFRRQSLNLHATSVWQEKTDAIRRAKNEAARVEAEAQRQRGRSPMVKKMSTPPFEVTHSTFAQ